MKITTLSDAKTYAENCGASDWEWKDGASIDGYAKFLWAQYGGENFNMSDSDISLAEYIISVGQDPADYSLPMPPVVNYTLTSWIGMRKGTTKHTELTDAILALGQEPHVSAGFSITFAGPHGECEIDLIADIGPDGELGIDGRHGAMLIETAGIDPRLDDDDGFHWPHAVTLAKVADAAKTFVGPPAIIRKSTGFSPKN